MSRDAWVPAILIPWCAVSSAIGFRDGDALAGWVFAVLGSLLVLAWLAGVVVSLRLRYWRRQLRLAQGRAAELEAERVVRLEALRIIEEHRRGPF